MSYRGSSLWKSLPARPDIRLVIKIISQLNINRQNCQNCQNDQNRQNHLNCHHCESQLTWVPILWAQGELRRAWNEGLICGEHLYHALNRQNWILQKGILLLEHKHWKTPCHRDFIDLRDKNGDLLCLAWVDTLPIFSICILTGQSQLTYSLPSVFVFCLGRHHHTFLYQYLYYDLVTTSFKELILCIGAISVSVFNSSSNYSLYLIFICNCS